MATVSMSLPRFTTTILWIFLLLFHQFYTASSQEMIPTCGLCDNGKTPAPFPEKKIDIMLQEDDFPLFTTCGDVESSLAAGSQECDDNSILFGSFCGCPVAEDACLLCPEGSTVAKPSDGIPLLEGEYGFVPSCALFQENVKALSSSSPECAQTQNLVTFLCGGCITEKLDNDTLAKNETGQDNGAASCALCDDGQTPAPFPDKKIDIMLQEDFPFATCGDLESSLAAGSQECSDNSILLGSFCGCPAADDACLLCPEGSTVAKPTDGIPLLEGEYGFIPSCALFQENVKALSSTSPDCTQSQGAVTFLCGGCMEELDNDALAKNETGQDNGGGGGSDNKNETQPEGVSCALCPAGQSILYPSKEIDILGDDFPFPDCSTMAASMVFLDPASKDCSDLSILAPFCGCELASEPCTLCPDGSSIPDPKMEVPLMEPLFGFIASCGLLEVVARASESNSGECSSLQYISGICSCPSPYPADKQCSFCYDDDILEDPQKKVPHLGSDFLGTRIVPTCKEADSLISILSTEELNCPLTKLMSATCCVDPTTGERNNVYLGADTEAKRALFAWSSVVSGLLSLAGSTLIIRDVVKSGTAKAKLYHQLMLFISVFDIFNSVSWMFSSLMVPEYDEYGFKTYIYGARGNQGTCVAQGFFLQLGYTGIFYQAALSIYFLLVIRYGWRESRLQSKRVWFLVPAGVVGSALAFAGIPSYSNLVILCHLHSPPFAEWAETAILVIFPICFAIFVMTCSMIAITMHVRKILNAGQKWTLNKAAAGEESTNKDWRFWRRRKNKAAVSPVVQNNQRMMAQVMFYLCSFYVTWPILLVPHIMQEKLVFNTHYGFWLAVTTMAPLQGFWTASVYFRPRILKWLQDRRRKKRREKEQKEQAMSQQIQGSSDQSRSIKLSRFFMNRQSGTMDRPLDLESPEKGTNARRQQGNMIPSITNQSQHEVPLQDSSLTASELSISRRAEGSLDRNGSPDRNGKIHRIDAAGTIEQVPVSPTMTEEP